MTSKILLPFQQKGVEYLTQNRTALLSDEMGLGKTAQVLNALPKDGSILIIVPAFLRYTWKREIEEWVPNFQLKILDKKNFEVPKAGEIILCSYDSVPETIAKIQCTHIIFDEAHQLKNLRTKRYKKLYPLGKYHRENNGYLWLVTGTPFLNSPPELWAICRFLGWEKELFGSYSNFIKSFNGFWTGKYWIWGDTSPLLAEKIQKKILRREKIKELPNLPAKLYRKIFLPPPSKQNYEYCTEIFDKYSDVLEKIQVIEEKKIPFSEFSKAMTILAEGKIKDLHQVVKDFENRNLPLVVFSAHRRPVESFKGREGWGCITGETSYEVRQSIIDAFQRGELRGIAATIQAAGVGLTITESSNVVFCDLSFTPALNAQAEDRIHRMGQKNICTITYLICDHPLDISLHRILSRKTVLFDQIFNIQEN